MKIETIEENKQSGFTLVELAIVMIIIGLLIGGILKGQELIANSQVTATIAQVKGIDAAMSTFRDKYGALPGDLNDAQTRLPNCTAANLCQNVAGGAAYNGRIDGDPSGPYAGIASESAQAWVHLARANMMTGIEPNNGPVFGGVLPAAPVGGGFRIGHRANQALNGIAAAANVTPGHYLVLVDAPGVTTNGVGARLEAVQAGQIDRKLDDGSPTTGTVVSGGGNSCVNAGNYDEGNNAATCYLAAQIQG